MLRRMYDFFNIVSITLWIVFIYILKAKWTFSPKFNTWFIGVLCLLLIVGMGMLSLFLTKFLDSDNLEHCIESEPADASSLSVYIGYFFVAFGVQDMHQLSVAFILISIFLYLVRWQYFNVTYLLFGYHYYYITTDEHVKCFIICRRRIRSATNLKFENLQRINDLTYIEIRRNKNGDETVCRDSIEA